jgi:hypothetical protein
MELNGAKLASLAFLQQLFIEQEPNASRLFLPL